MNGSEFIKLKQRNWAKNQGFIAVSGTLPDKGEKNYLTSIEENLFKPLSKENAGHYHSGDGNETSDSKTRLAKMKALHSSSALVVNLFQYWQGRDATPLLSACGMWGRGGKVAQLFKNIGSSDSHVVNIPQKPLHADIRFEEHFEISGNKVLFPRTPNLDVFIPLGSMDIAIEAKFTEPYGGKHNGLKEKYVEEVAFWDGLPHLHELAKTISPEDTRFRYLDV